MKKKTKYPEYRCTITCDSTQDSRLLGIMQSLEIIAEDLKYSPHYWAYARSELWVCLPAIDELLRIPIEDPYS